MAANTIIARAKLHTKERTAGGAITPGHLVALNTSGQVVVNGAAAATNAQKAFALEDQAQGRDIDDAYAATETVLYQVFQPGDEIYAWLENGANVAIGAALESNGAGELQALTAGEVVGYALEAVNASGGAERIRIEVA
jgi:hypothetical protein